MGDSIVSGLDEHLLSRKRKVKVKCFPGATVDDMYDNMKPILRRNPEYLIIHVGTNDAVNLLPNEILDRVLALKNNIMETNKNCKVIISMPTNRCDKHTAESTVRNLNNSIGKLYQL